MKKLTLFFFLFSSLLFSQNKFYNYYTNGLEYLEKQDWLRAIAEFKSASSLEFEDVQRKRTYGTRFIEYYPHREMGIAHYMLSEMDAAKKELELSIAYRATDRAEEYYKRITGGVLPQKIVKKEPAKEPEKVTAKKEEPRTEPKIIETKPQQQPEQQPPVVTVNATAKPSSPEPGSIIVVTRKYDPSGLPQVGSRLAVAVLPFEAIGEAKQSKDIVTNELITELVNLRRFKVIERSAMDKIVGEQKLQASGFVDDKTAVKLGKSAGADALIIGIITVSGSTMKISARLVDVETGETLTAQTAVAEKANQEAIDVAVANVATGLYNELPIIEGDIIKVDAEELFIDIGSLNGLRKGTKCVVFREGESIKHPISGEILGKKVTRLGEIIVIQVNDKFAAVKTLENEQDFQVGDKVIIK